MFVRGIKPKDLTPLKRVKFKLTGLTSLKDIKREEQLSRHISYS